MSDVPAPSPAAALARANAAAQACVAGAATGATQGCSPPPGLVVVGRPEFEQATLAALAQIQALPTGAALLARIAGSGQQCVIRETLEGNTCGYLKGDDAVVREDGSPGPGTLTVVRFNPARTEIGQQEPWQTRPPAIGLAHELIHAMHGTEGTIDRRLVQNDSLYDEKNPSLPLLTKYEEFRTVGVPPHDAEPITENAIRREWPVPQPQRPYY